MIYNDPVFGEIEINEPVILELINSPTLQRLKGIDQAGYEEPFFPGVSFSRFEHSLGDFYLLKIYGAPLYEQIAGLIHDVSHSAFSHTIDYVLPEGSEKEQSHQDNVFPEFVLKSAIPKILKKYSINLNYILDDKNFPLKETKLPDLCADRIDYSLRKAVHNKQLNQKEILNYYLENLTTQDNKWVFKKFEVALSFAKLFSNINKTYFAGFPTAIMFKTSSDYLKYALEKGYIETKDLYTTDKEVLKKIAKHLTKDEKLKLLFDRLNNGVKVTQNPKDYDARIFIKSRAIDPLCIHRGKLKRVSEIDSTWKEIVEKELEPKEYFLKFAK